MKRIIKFSVISYLATFPVVVLAAVNVNGPKDLKYIIALIISYLNQALFLLIGVAIVIFVYNVIQYYIKPNPEGRKDANLYVMYSLIGFFVVLSLWGLVNILQKTFNLDNNPTNWSSFQNLFPSGSYTTGTSGVPDTRGRTGVIEM